MFAPHAGRRHSCGGGRTDSVHNPGRLTGVHSGLIVPSSLETVPRDVILCARISYQQLATTIAEEGSNFMINRHFVIAAILLAGAVAATSAQQNPFLGRWNVT